MGNTINLKYDSETLEIDGSGNLKVKDGAGGGSGGGSGLGVIFYD